MLIVIIVVFDLEAHQYDVVNVFTNSLLDEVVYYSCPKDYTVAN